MRVLIIDDSSSKLAEITSVVRDTSESFHIDCCLDCVTSILLMKKKYDLLILDLFLPLRNDQQPINTGGKYIVDQIMRNKEIKPPTYLIGLTQYDELIDDFHPIWKALKYDPTSISWKQSLRELLIYVSKQNASDDRIIIEKIPTIYLEGKTDEILFSEALRLFFPDYIDKIRIKTAVSAGADWVTRQLIVWGFSLPKNSEGVYIKSVGIYDNDNKGNTAIEELHRTVGHTTAESQCIKAVKYLAKHARHLIPIYQKGVKLPISIEQMFEPAHWAHAKSQNWLEEKNNIDSLLDDPKGWDKMKLSLKKHLEQLGLKEDESIYLMGFKDECKKLFCNYVINMTDDDKRNALKCFAPFISEILEFVSVLDSKQT